MNQTAANPFAWADAALKGEVLSKDDARRLLADESIDVAELAAAAGKVRRHYFGKKVKVHQINNVQNGLCPEDCGYCGQAKSSDAPVNKYPMKSEDEIIEDAKKAKEQGVFRYCMVSSGRGLNDKKADDWSRILGRLRDEVGIRTCLSVGLVSYEQACKLKEAGLDRLNHNLNTSEQHTPNIVSSHTYQDRVDTIQNAQKAGLDNCSGMICGMGESDDDILEVAYRLRDMKVPSIPINFLIPIEGNRLYDFGQLSPERCVRILCLFRFINPSAEVRVGGGREGHLRTLQTLALWPANSLFVEGYLVTRGDAKSKVYRMIEDAGFELDGAPAPVDASPADKFQIDEDPNILHPKAGKREAWTPKAPEPTAMSGSCGSTGGGCGSCH